jgi:two-component system, cell cycle sensor histidine kinase and response regulator CckA
MSKHTRTDKRSTKGLESLRRRLRMSEQRLRLVLDGAELGLWDWDVRRGAVLLDEHAREMLGQVPQQGAPQTCSWEELIHPADWPGAREELQAHLEGRRSRYETEYRVRHQSGEWIWVRARGEIVARDRAGRPLRCCGAHVNITPTKRREAALAELAEKHRRLQANIPGLVYEYVLRPDGSHAFPFVGPEVRELFGLEPEDVMRDGTRLSGLIHPDDRQRRDASIHESARTLQPWRQDLRHIVGGQVRWHACMSRPELQPDGAVRWDGIMLDITDRRRAEEKVAAAARNWQTTFDAVQDAIWMLDERGRIERCNAATARHFGLDSSQVLGRHCWEIVHGTTEPIPECPLLRMRRSKRRESMELRSGPRCFNVIVDPILDDAGNVSGAVHIVSDITQRKQAEEERARLVAILEGTSDVVLTAAPDGRLSYANTAGRRLLGWGPAEDVGGRSLSDAYPAWAAAILRDESIPAAINERVWAGETALMHRGGYEIPVSQVIMAHRDSNGQVQYLSTIMRDITERKRSEEALRESEAKYRALFESAGDGIFLLSVEGEETRVEDCNRRALELFGLMRDQTADLEMLKLSPAHQPDGRASRAAAAKHIWRALAGETQLFEWRHCRMDGSLFDADVVLTGVPLGTGRHLLAIMRDITARRCTEEALVARERLLNNIIEQNPYSMWISDAQGTLIRTNRACCELLNVREEEIVGKYNVLKDNIVRDQGRLPLVESVFREGRTARFTLEYDSSKLQSLSLERTTRVVLEVTIAPVKSADGAITNAIVMHHDITQRKRAENELRESEAKYRALSQEFRSILDAIPGSLVLISPDLKIVWANEFAARSLSLTLADFLGQHCYLCRHKRSEPCEVCAVQRCFASGKPESGEGETFDGRIWQLQAAPVFGDRGEINGAIEVAYDVTEKRRADRELKASESMLRSVFRATPIGITFNIDRVIVSANDSMCELTGYSQQEFLGKSARMFYVTEEEYENVGRQLYAQLPQKGHTSVETQFRRKDGTLINVVLTGGLLRTEDPASGFVVTLQDITERKRAEQEKQKLEAQLRQAQKMEAIGQLAGGVAHDFNNILTAIFGHVELAIADLEARLPAARGTLDVVQQIQRSAERASTLTRQLLAFGRRQVVQLQVVDLNATLRNLEKMLKRLITEDIELTILAAPDLPAVEADPGQLEQAIVNLVVNARDAMPEGGKLVLRTRRVVLDEDHVAAHTDARAGEHVLLSVSDTGCGMSAATLERIFEPFYTTKPIGCGSGLGLPTVYGIVKQAGGHITVHSAPGQGTEFCVYLPGVHKPTTADKQVCDAQVAPSGTETVLLCEDDTAVRELAAQLLADAGYKVLVARNGADALQLAEHHAGMIHLLLTDVVMPEMNGRQLSDLLTARRPNVRTLFASGYPANVIARHGVLEKNVEFLEKPFSRCSLLRRVRDVLDKPGSAQPQCSEQREGGVPDSRGRGSR